MRLQTVLMQQWRLICKLLNLSSSEMAGKTSHLLSDRYGHIYARLLTVRRLIDEIHPNSVAIKTLQALLSAAIVVTYK